MDGGNYIQTKCVHMSNCLCARNAQLSYFVEWLLNYMIIHLCLSICLSVLSSVCVCVCVECSTNYLVEKAKMRVIKYNQNSAICLSVFEECLTILFCRMGIELSDNPTLLVHLSVCSFICLFFCVERFTFYLLKEAKMRVIK
jgi:hypothetical protein